MLLNLDEIKKSQDVKISIVPMPEWGGDIKLKALNFCEQIHFEAERQKINNDSDLILLLLGLCIVDDNNTRIFDDQSMDILKGKNASCLLRLFKACLELNSLDENSVEEKAKN